MALAPGDSMRTLKGNTREVIGTLNGYVLVCPPGGGTVEAHKLGTVHK